ncbi:MAG: DUF2497 domain-containing protein [Patescibacteria group bacterium]|nr:DUF2497 domain-containing protein [Patescibacteria group bacterium]
MSKITSFVLIGLSIVSLSGCDNKYIQNKVDQYSDSAEEKLNTAVEQIETRVKDEAGEAIEAINQKISDAIKLKVNEWLDKNLPSVDKESLSDNDYARLIDGNSELKELFAKH